MRNRAADDINTCERDHWSRQALAALRSEGRESDIFRRARLTVHVYDMLLRGAAEFTTARRRLADTEPHSRNKFAEGERLLAASQKARINRVPEPA